MKRKRKTLKQKQTEGGIPTSKYAVKKKNGREANHSKHVIRVAHCKLCQTKARSYRELCT